MSSRRSAAWGLLLLAFGLSGCVHLREGLHSQDVDALRKEARGAGLELVDPLVLSQRTVDEVRLEVGRWGTPTERLRRLMRFLVDGSRVHFQYQLNHSLTAEEAFVERRGDCMAYTNLFVAMARALDVPVYFVRRSEVSVFYEHDDVLYVSTHMAVAHHATWGTLLVDFSAQHTDSNVSLYKDTSDADAFALFYSNVAMDRLVTGDAAYAERLLRFLLEKRPNLQELHANLGVVLMDEGRPADALAVYHAALARFPDELPLYMNAAQAARAAGQPELAERLLDHAGRLTGSDPSFLFNRGLARFQSARYQSAAEDFRHAARSQPDNAVILTWMVRAYLSAGKADEGKRAYEHLTRVAPQSRWVGQLREQFPELALARP